MRLLSGPAGSGKTAYVLDRFREALHAGNTAVRLLVPTATMAQHLQNRLAREGYVFRPELIQTLSNFLRGCFPRGWTGDAPEVPLPVLYLIVERAVERAARPEFERVAGFPGFSASLARAIDEFASAGCDSERLAANLPEVPLGEAFLAVYREVDRELERRGLALRGMRLLAAAEKIAAGGLNGVKTVWLDGFHALPDPELAVIAALGKHAELTLTMDEAELTDAMAARLGALEFSEERARGARPNPAIVLVKAPGIEREAEEIARRILEQAEAGRPFREIGVIVRTPEIYEDVLRATLERFGIPARFYFDLELERHPAIRYLTGAMDAMLGGWDHSATLAVLRLSPRMTDSRALDWFDFKVRECIPRTGLDGLRELLPENRELDNLASLEGLRGLVLAPAEWAARLKTLRAIFRLARPMETASHELALQYRSQAVALDTFDEALDEAAQALGGSASIPLADFWRALKSVLRLKPLRIDDRRRNVVQVMSAHEARQWVLPVVFVCGMVEKQFPRFHPPDPFFNDVARCKLNAAGIRVRTAAEFEREERLLFDSAITRATILVTLSYPEFDSRGERTLESLFLESLIATPVDAQPVRPESRIVIPGRAATEIRDPRLLAYVAERTERLSPTGLEMFLQCPFQYFTQKLLYLKTAPDRPEQRLDFLTQGNIVHEVLAEWWNQPQEIAPLFERVFARVLKEKFIPPGYHTERLRNAMLGDVVRFTKDAQWRRDGYRSETEREFCFPLTQGVEIKGRIDRLDIAGDDSAFVMDYKYSAAQNVKKKLENENLLQAPLYMMAAEHLGYRPAGMYYIGVKGAVEYVGWRDSEIPEDWLDKTRRRTLEIVSRIRAGQIEIQPADRENCRFCDAKDVCRVETEAEVAVEVLVEGA